MSGPHVHLTHHRPDIAVVRIDRPPVNALGPGDWHALRLAITELAADGAMRAVVITGSPDAFCAGADIRTLKGPSADRPDMLATVGDACTAIRQLEVPVVAAIDGAAHGGGLELALACDVRIADSDATFAASSVNMGLIASVASLIDTIGGARAKRMLLTGDRIAASTAHDWGLITDLVEGTAIATGLELAEKLAAKPPLAVAAIKRAANAAPSANRADLDSLVSDLFTSLAQSEDHGEAVRSFLEKRPGSYSGK